MKKIIDRIAGEIIETSSVEVLFDECINRVEEYGTRACIRREITIDEQDYLIYIERGNR